MTIKGSNQEMDFRKVLKSCKKTEIPVDVDPMLATLVQEPAEGEQWIYEVKWDGFRALVYNNGKSVDIRSRNNKSFNEKFYPLHASVAHLPVSAVIDGEIVALNNKGVPDFSALQTWRSEADGYLAFFAFDILWLNGYDLTNLPLEKRRETLKQVIP